jgi:hypothetical protein
MNTLPLWWPAVPAIVGAVLIIDWREIKSVIIQWWREPKF